MSNQGGQYQLLGKVLSRWCRIMKTTSFLHHRNSGMIINQNLNQGLKKPLPAPLPRIKIEQVDKALKGYTKSFEIGIKNNKDPLEQLQSTRKAIEHHIESILTSMKGLKFVETLKVTFKKSVNDETVYKTAHFNSKAQTIINNTEIPEALQLSKQQILNMVAQWISEGSGWTIESVDNHYLNIVPHTSNYHKNSEIVKRD